MSIRRKGAAVLIMLAASALVLLVAVNALAGVAFSARVEAGAQPRLSTADVKAIVVTQLDTMADAVGAPRGGSAEAIATTLGHVDEFIADAPILNDAGWKDTSVVWVVRAQSTFVTFRGRSPEARTADSGWFILDDGTGEIIAMGFPLTTPEQ